MLWERLSTKGQNPTALEARLPVDCLVKWENKFHLCLESLGAGVLTLVTDAEDKIITDMLNLMPPHHCQALPHTHQESVSEPKN